MTPVYRNKNYVDNNLLTSLLPSLHCCPPFSESFEEGARDVNNFICELKFIVPWGFIRVTTFRIISWNNFTKHQFFSFIIRAFDNDVVFLLSCLGLSKGENVFKILKLFSDQSTPNWRPSICARKLCILSEDLFSGYCPWWNYCDDSTRLIEWEYTE